MTEAQFFRRTAVVATGLTVLVVVVDRAIPHAPAPVMPFGEPWLTIVGSVVVWSAIVVVAHVGRWAYFIVRAREPRVDS